MSASSSGFWMGGAVLAMAVAGGLVWHSLQTVATTPAQPKAVAVVAQPAKISAPPRPALPLPPIAPGDTRLPSRAPLNQTELPTTDGEIALGNLEASLHGAELMLRDRPKDAVAYVHLVGILLLRGHVRGLVADYERAAEIAAKAVQIAPQDARSFIAHAQTAALFHEFAQTLADLEKAEALARQHHDEELLPAIRERRASALRAMGKLDEAQALLLSLGSALDIGQLTTLASLYAERGDFENAEALFIEAQRHHPDVAPFPLVALYLQQGLMWEARGNLLRAHELYSAAHERLPAHAAIISHLASIEAARAQRQKAIELLQPLVKSADDPEYAGQLSALLREAGEDSAAMRLRTQAETRYKELLARHPAAFAAHAARFYLGAGSDAKEAAKWAEANLAQRKTDDSYVLAIEATTAAGISPRACALADEMGMRSGLTARMHVMAARAYQSCGQKARADEELAKIPPP